MNMALILIYTFLYHRSHSGFRLRYNNAHEVRLAPSYPHRFYLGEGFSIELPEVYPPKIAYDALSCSLTCLCTVNEAESALLPGKESHSSYQTKSTNVLLVLSAPAQIYVLSLSSSLASALITIPLDDVSRFSL